MAAPLDPADTPATSQDDLARGIVGSAPAAARVAEVMRLLPQVLLREDPRVQTAFAVWWARMEQAEEQAEALVRAGADPSPLAVQALQEDAAALFALVRSLGLDRYRWLPRMLRWEFQRVAEERAAGVPMTLEITTPGNLSWATPGKRPKQRPGKWGGFRLEHIERNILWFYLCEVKHPPVTKKQLAIAQGCARCDVQHAIRRARILLACINRTPPT
jgi:hypothetical protein